jgi:hypothetical protein
MEITGLEPANAEIDASVETGAADANPVETEGADPAPAAAETGKPERDKVQERFDKLTREKYEGLSRAERAEYKAQLLEQQLAELRSAPAKTETVAPSDDYPRLESVGWDEAKHAAAVSAWSAKQAREAAKAELAAEREAAERDQTAKVWERRQADFIKSTPEYAEKVLDGARRGAWALTDETLSVCQASDIGPQILMYLAENADKSAEIARLPAYLQAREIGRIEARLEAQKAAPPPVSKAPPPASRIEAAESVLEKDPAEMTPAQFAKWRQKFIK